jgi:hypothetical protein
VLFSPNQIAAGNIEVLLTILVVVLLTSLIGSIPTWPRGREWGYYQSGGLGVVLSIILVLFLLGRF